MNLLPDKVAKVLIIDDVPENLRLLMGLLREFGFEVATALNGTMALQALSKIQPDLILLDLMMSDMDGYEVCRRLKADPKSADIPVIFISALSDNRDKLRAFDVGGVDYICKPFEAEEVLVRIRTHLDLRHALKVVEQQKAELEQEKGEREKTEETLTRYQEQLSGLLTGQLLHPKAFRTMLTQDKKMHALFQYVEALSCSNEPVMILGESGVGKELFAKAIHEVCAPQAPWVAVNIAGFDDNIFSDTLFGHIKGAFTDATQDRAGMVEHAAGGILFLDEIGELSHASQVKLLRLLQEKEYLPLGSDRPRKADCRIVVATNLDLHQQIKTSAFRRDLYYRLATHTLKIPTLRERKKDIPLLLEQFLEAAATQMKKKKPTYPLELLLLLENYSFPGNVRELRAMVFDAMSRHKNRMLSMDSFKAAIGTRTTVDNHQATPNGELCFPQQLPTLKDISRLLTDEALRRTDGNQSMAARLLGITPAALSMRLKKWAQTPN